MNRLLLFCWVACVALGLVLGLPSLAAMGAAGILFPRLLNWMYAR